MHKKQRRNITPPLQWLRAFEASARHLSFTNAAEELLITQSAVSKQVRLLEHHLNQMLFLRERRGLRLTEPGRNYLPTVRRAFNTLEQGTRNFLGYSTDQNFHIKSNFTFSTYWLAEYLDEFMMLYPDLQITVSTALWEQDFSGSVSDIEIHYGKKEWFSKKALQLTRERIFPVCSPRVAKSLSNPSDMQNSRILDLTGISDSWDFWAQRAGLSKCTFDDRHYFSTFVLSLEMAKHDKGITLCHETFLAPLTKRKELVVPFDLPVDGRDHYFVVQTETERPHPMCEPFLEWMKAKFASD